MKKKYRIYNENTDMLIEAVSINIDIIGNGSVYKVYVAGADKRVITHYFPTRTTTIIEHIDE